MCNVFFFWMMNGWKEVRFQRTLDAGGHINMHTYMIQTK